LEIRGSIAVVTGASSGIGLAAARSLAREGATVVVAARREDRLQALAGEIERDGGRALPAACDVSDLGQVETLAGGVRSAFGRCDILVNNAGIPGGGPFAELAIDQVERVVRVNFMGVLYCTKAFLPMMLGARRGHIINIASMAGRYAVPGASMYTATKHAVVAFSEALYYELESKGILVTAVNPGLVVTEGFPHRDAAERGRGRLVMTPERVADVIIDVVRSGRAPEVSIPRWLASLQAVRILAPPLYRFGLKRVARGVIRPTRAGGHSEPTG
jgi:short-subunit dehydrogenase